MGDYQRIHTHPGTGRRVLITRYKRVYHVAVEHREIFYGGGGFRHPLWHTFIIETGVSDGLSNEARREIVEWAASLPASDLPADDVHPDDVRGI